jgi:hypothetical protein
MITAFVHDGEDPDLTGDIDGTVGDMRMAFSSQLIEILTY